MEYIFEAKINTEDRNKLPDSAFGIPSKRKYPLTDEKHVLQAVRFFNKADEEDKSELAHNIVKRAKELNMDWEKWDVLKPYLDKPIKEAYAKELHSTPEADEIYTYLSKSVEYDNASPETWRLKSPDELTDHNKGNCHDTAWFVFKNLDAYAKHPVDKGILFFIEYREGKKEGGQTHSVCYEKIPDGICIIECSWQGMAGTFPYNNINEYVSVVKNNWEFTGDNDKLYATEIKNTSQIHPGMTLNEYVFVAMKNKEIITESYVPHPDDDYTSGTSDFNHDDDDPDDCYCESDKERVNDKGEIVPDKCTKCDSPIEIYLKGEPVYLCSNKKCGKYYGTVPCNINESHQMSETEAFYKRWKDEEGSSVLKQAKDIVKKIAKKVKDDEQPPCGNQNCKLCTWCAEAQFRGIDVLPRPLYSPRDPALDIIGETIVKDPVRISIQNGYDGMLEHLMEPTANVARFYCHVNWNNSTGGHEFIILKIGKQSFFIVDGQAGIVEPLSDTGNYFNDINYANSYICRLDNRDFNKELFEKYNDPKSIVPWDGRLDIPYMLENRMLSEEEAEQYWKEHPDEKPVQESKMILNSNDSRIPKLMCEGWKIAGTTINNEYILIQEGYDDISLHVSLVPATMSDVPNMEVWEYECMKDAYPNREIPESEVDKLKAELHQDAIDSVHKTRMIQYDGQTIGMLTAYKVLDDQYWYIAEIYLIEEYRGKGIAKYILKNEIDQHDKLILNVYQNNKHAIELYESLGFEITQDGDGRFIMELDKTKHKTKYQPSNVFTLDEYKKANKYRSVIVGEIHNSSMLKYYDKLLSERKPEYFISEFAHEDRVLSLPELKQKLDMATNGEFKPGIPDYQDNYAIYKLAYDHGCKLIGCDLNNGKHYNRMHDEDHEREAYMLKVLEEFENTKFVCQLGDHHLRSIPITKEFLDYCGDTKDDRGIVSDLTVDNASPIWVHFTHEPNDVAILREPNELKNELDFINQQTIQEGYWQDIKNGVNPKSKKVWFHVSFDDKLDEKGPMIPRIPTWLEEVKKDGYTTSEGKKTHDLDEVMKDTGRYENYTTPRVCFSPSIEGALNSIINMWKLKNKDFPGKQLYVYVPEKPISQYKHKTNKELIRDKEVFDAGTTGESWILEPVKVKFYGSIKIDKVKDNGRKHKVLIRPGFEKETDNPMDNYIGRFTYKWHWLIHPSILKQGEKYEKSEKKAL